MGLLLETERLRLRAFQDRDIPGFAAYRSDPEVAKYQSWEPPFSIEQATEFVHEMKTARLAAAGEWYQIAVEFKGNAALIGDCAFHIFADDPQQAEIGFTLASAHQGQGYGSEAVMAVLDFLFGELSLHRVRATCDVENLASSRLLERVGMRREAHLVENIWFKGAWGSEYAYALLRRDWLRQSAP